MCDAVYEHMVGERGPENTKIQHWFDDDEGEGAVLVRCSRSALEVSVLRRVGRGDPATYSRATLDDGGIEALRTSMGLDYDGDVDAQFARDLVDALVATPTLGPASESSETLTFHFALEEEETLDCELRLDRDDHPVAAALYDDVVAHFKPQGAPEPDVARVPQTLNTEGFRPTNHARVKAPKRPRVR